ncbi:DNA ligase 4-like isoform X2 [Vigna unguiculata]|uniref:DNA ligase 4-like isoform X2 n=1 Tax=Vigna unguiculata TaxID=3917 RepID=UPI0010161AF0|nr:DNA ligase 4-like isoform X2 [Vigna unguiculata]
MQWSKSAVKKGSKFRKFLDAFFIDRNFFPAIRLILPNLASATLTDSRNSSSPPPSSTPLASPVTPSMPSDSSIGVKVAPPPTLQLEISSSSPLRQGTASGGLTIRELNELLYRLASEL